MMVHCGMMVSDHSPRPAREVLKLYPASRGSTTLNYRSAAAALWPRSRECCMIFPV
ncbi:predicted protein [Botrytis cinerea T4]|uniref:Uncharacterized protein n=1 Tax=Botryotinia fuckeliana (strain T4) TaxID=999810 RepID=G2YRR7_BOTF4|nr:predicted protein [Botrytis cinerea T4]